MRRVHGRCEHAPAPRHPRGTGDPAGARNIRFCIGCHGCRTRCASGRPAGSTAKQRPALGDAIYSVPHGADRRAGVGAGRDRAAGRGARRHELQGPREVARYQLTTPGRPSIKRRALSAAAGGRAGASVRVPAQSEEREFLAIGEGAERWLKRAAAEGTSRIRRKMAEAVDLAKLHGIGSGQRGIGAVRELRPVRRRGPRVRSSPTSSRLAELIPFPARSEDHSLQRSTRSWEGLGR